MKLVVLDQDIENPIRAEIFSVERIEEYASFLAAELQISKDPRVLKTLLPRMRENGEKLLSAYRTLAQAIHNKESISPGAEWLVDNFHIVEEQLREIRQDLPVQFYKELPKLALGELAGFPRIYALALALVAHTDSRLEIDTIRRFIVSFQKVAPLCIGELWALAITLRLVLVENLSRFSTRILRDRTKRAIANNLADKLIEAVTNKNEFRKLTTQIPDICSKSVENDYAFIAQLAKRLRDQEPEHWPAIESLEKHLNVKGFTTEQAVHFDHQMQASNQVTVANIITSMRLLSSLDWQDFFESVSLVDRILETDPEGSYENMDFVTRDHYRHVVEKLSKKTQMSELDVAKKIVNFAAESLLKAPTDRRRSHVGYYLIGEGLPIAENYFSKKISFSFLNPKLIYFGLILFFIFLFTWVPVSYARDLGYVGWTILGIVAIAVIPISEMAIGFTHFMVTHLVPPRRLPKMDLSPGIPVNGRAIVVVPCLLSSLKTVDEILEKVEIHYLGNSDAELYFAILTDFCDSERETTLDDETILNHALGGVAKLNEKYGNQGLRSFANIFYILNRKRLWNSSEKAWMGWERKRGKLNEFNRVLRGAIDTSFENITASTELLQSIKYVITLDADTQMPRESAKKMIGTILHPLNRAYFDQELGRVTQGYGILQPRISISIESSSRSFFTRIFSGYIGIDPYTTAVSDVYQDIFHEGNYTGKGLYDVDVFEAALKGRVPENTILSHDLFEGLYARAALISDVELFDDYPQTYDSFFTRQHRWIRGDWQIARWLLPYVPNSDRVWVRNDLSIRLEKLIENEKTDIIP